MQVKSFAYSTASGGVGVTERLVLGHDKLLDLCSIGDRSIDPGSYSRSDDALGKDDDLITGGHEECYIIVAIFGTYDPSGASAGGTGGGGSRYSLLASFSSAITPLMSGVPVRSAVGSDRYEYFKFTLLQPRTDVMFAVTALSGDPDMYIGLSPLVHPTRFNNTWFQSQLGSDTLVLQADEISKRCIPNPRLGKHCDLYVGVYGWRNSTFTVVAVADEGYQSAATLLEQQPQSGFAPKGTYR